jgi:hypothetical protein
MCIEIFGYRSPAVRDYARDLGVALQLTNILRDVAPDFRKGRVYLPRRTSHGSAAARRTSREVSNAGTGLASERLRAVLEHQAARARLFFSRAVVPYQPTNDEALSPPRSCVRSTGSSFNASRPRDAMCSVVSFVSPDPPRRALPSPPGGRYAGRPIAHDA